MNTRFSEEDEVFRGEIAGWLADNLVGEFAGLRGRGGPGDDHALIDERKAWERRLGEAGWIGIGLPASVGGRDLPLSQQVIFYEEYARAKGPGRMGHIGEGLLAPTLVHFGSEAQQKRFLPGILDGSAIWCQGYSEPGAGSDLANVQTRAELGADGWRLNGQKVWTSGAATADYGMLIARTDWDVPKHAGISFFFCPMKQPGIEVRPLRQITDESHFNEVFITDAIVPADNLLGDANTGWRVLQTALAYERSILGDAARGARSGAKEAHNEEVLIALAREAGVLADPALRQDIAQAIAYKRLNALNNARVKADMKQGTTSSAMSLGKLAMSRVLHEEGRVRTAILGAQSLLEGSDYPRAEDANFLTLNAYFTSIGGGTDQIQRNIIGERVLGLPKEPEVDTSIPFRDVRTS